jgi:hypothetical protein
MSRSHFGYDIFISHNRADKAWVRRLDGWLARQQYNGRRLRPWLDEQFLDPGNLGSEAELTTALDRSRVLGLVLSPDAVASTWVDFEVRHFLAARNREAIVILLLRDCVPPPALHGVTVVDFRDEGQADEQLGVLLARLCPPGDARPVDAERGVDVAFERVHASDPGGFSAEPTPERDAFFDQLTRYDIDDPAEEGVAVAAFTRAADHLLRVHADGSGAAYNGKMLLGECLAAALHRSSGYRQVAQRFLDLAATVPGGPILLFVVARAYSKLAELDTALVDASVLLRAVSQLDAVEQAGNELRAIETLIGRVIGKLRDTAAGELLIKILTGRGRASRIVAAGAISLSYEKSGPVFYLSELERLEQQRGQEQVSPAGPPSRRLLGELFGLTIDQDPSVQRALQLARSDIEQAFPGTDFPYGLFWFIRREVIDPAGLHNAPFTGTIARATLKNMVDLSGRVGVSTVATLTEPRIVDSLFDGCGALLILQQDPGSPQCRRLRDRGVPFAMLTAEVMGSLADGDHVVVDRQMQILKK